MTTIVADAPYTNTESGKVFRFSGLPKEVFDASPKWLDIITMQSLTPEDKWDKVKSGHITRSIFNGSPLDMFYTGIIHTSHKTKRGFRILTKCIQLSERVGVSFDAKRTLLRDGIPNAAPLLGNRDLSLAKRIFLSIKEMEGDKEYDKHKENAERQKLLHIWSLLCPSDTRTFLWADLEKDTNYYSFSFTE